MRLTACGEVAALSATFNEAVRVPFAAGSKLSEIVQLAPTATVEPQVVVLVNEVASVPLIVMPPLVMVSGEPPVFLSVTTLAVLVDPTLVLWNVRVVGVKATVGGGTVPVRVMDCGDAAALSATFNVAVRVPPVSGLKRSERVQVAPTATVAPQVVVVVNEEASVPVIVIPPLLMVNVEPPVFFSVTTLATLVDPTFVLGNVTFAGVSVTVGGGTVPLRVTDCGDPAALSATFNVPARVPPASGLKLTEIVQLAPAASVAPQVVVLVNEEESVPLIVIPPLWMSSVAPPVFFSVTNLAVLVDPIFVPGNFRLTGVSETTGTAPPVPVPVRVTDCGDPVALSAACSVAVRVPAAAGLKVTEMVQLAATGRLPQVLVWVYEDRSVPMMEIVGALTVAFPVFVIVTVCAVLDFPTAVLVKVRVAGDRVTLGVPCTELQPLTRFVALAEPRPVARSYPVVAL